MFLNFEDPDSDSDDSYTDSDAENNDFNAGQQGTERERVAAEKAVRDRLTNNYF